MDVTFRYYEFLSILILSHRPIQVPGIPGVPGPAFAPDGPATGRGDSSPNKS